MGFSFFKSKNREKKKPVSVPMPGQRGERSSNPQVSIKLAEHFLREKKRDLAVDEYLNAAQAFLDKRQSQLAMAVYRNIITIDPERYGIYETLADLYRMSGFPGDGASVLLALAYQYQKAGHITEVKRVLDTVLEFAPDNQVLKRKVEAFFKADRRAGAAVPGAPAAGRASAPAQKPDADAEQAPVACPDIFAPPSVRASANAPEPAPEPQAPAEDDRPFDLKSALADDLTVHPASPAETGFDLRSKLEDDVLTPADEAVQKTMVDATAESFFDLQSALEADASLGFDYDPSADEFSGGEDGSLFSVLNVVKDIAVQDPRQDTPLFHFNLGIAYMQCADYEQAVDEFLSALYGIPEKIECYVRLAECSLNLKRRELACGFLREAIDHPAISPEQVQLARKRLEEISAG